MTLRPILCVAIVVVVLASVTGAAETDLIGWWKLDEGSGRTTADASGNGNDGAFQGNPIWTSGQSSRALMFNGVDDYVLCAERGGTEPGDYPQVLMPTEGFTVTCWTKLNAFAYFSSFVGNGIDTGDDECGFFFYNFGWVDENEQDFGLAIRTETGMHYIETPNIYETDTWYHLAATYDGENVVVYVDGAMSVGPESVGGPIRWVSASSGNYPERFAIGVWLDPGYDLWVDGAIDEVRYYSRALGQDEIAAVMSSNALLSSEPRPADKADDVSRDVSLAWTAGIYAAAHDIYLGTDVEDVSSASRGDTRDVLASQGQAETVYDPPGRLDFGQTYYWRVDEVNALPDGTVYEGGVWSFTTEPLAYAIEGVSVTTNGTSDDGEGPENTINGSGLNADDQHSTFSGDMWLAAPGDGPVWIEYEFDRVYKLHELLVWNYNVQFELVLGFGFKDVTVAYSEDGVDWTVLGDVEFARATAQATYTANTTVGFEGVAAKCVRLSVNSGWGMTGKYGLSEVRFTFIPVHAREPEPASGAEGVDVDAVLSWRAGREAASHEVYLGTDAEALAAAGATTESVYAPDSLEYGRRYHWRVDEVNSAEGISVWEGDIWTFATQEYTSIDDFESYVDDTESGQAIFDAWVDGWVNGTGSTVGYLEVPFTERIVVRGGQQSMPLMYDNAASPWYSEAERTFEGLQDWTGHGADTLVLYVHGAADNAAETLYVAIEDGAGNVAAVSHPDPAVLTASEWQAWVIGLDAFGAGGVQVDRVRALYVGIGDRDNPVAGGTGLVYIDDVQFGRAAAVD